jgi:UDP-GlcNAc:undecaprenyl-phosphate GlcNAc-1-phosphate transferase
VACIGFVDDLKALPVWAKLVGEFAIAASAIGLGFSWHISDSFVLNAGFSFLWIVGLTNSLNLLDNMDGLASTAAACSLVMTAALVPTTIGLTLPLAGAAVGFLVINRPRAKMYMGDTGSLTLGLGVALGSIWAANSTHGLHSFVILSFPVAIALFDTSLVIVSRLMTGRPVQLGGQDHFSHRLQLLGLQPLVILGVTIWGSSIAWACAALALLYPQTEAWLAVPIALAFVAAWALLLRVDPYAIANQPKIEVYRDQTGT